ncbi:transmembrane protein 116 isoform X2 [Cyclopterus lumpus]|uniref:transmembrane protein 116 isoform X2 n=1 Tax=Cyclopterus lumpus TaxID=8103 RepID=UPI001486F5F4|nr:transmembrane protein 116 isoform X2 [Cyclopterus lumpus]
MRQSHDESLARVWVWSGSGLVSSLQGGVSMLAEWAKSEWMTQAAQTFILHLSSLNMSTPDTLFTNSSERNTTGAKDWSEVYEAVRCIQLVMALLSVLGSGSIIVCVTSLRLRPSPELQPLFLLSVSDLLLALCWLIGAALFSQHCSRLNTHCYHLHTVEQILYMASFFYTLNYVLNLYTGIRDKFYSCINRVPPQSVSCSADDAGVHTRKHQPMSGQLQRALQVSPDAHRSTVSHVPAPADNHNLQPAAHLPHRRLPRHLLPHPPQHHRACGESPSYLQAGRDLKRLPGPPAAGLLPRDGPADAAVPADLHPLLGSSGESGSPSAADALDRSGCRRRRLLHISGVHLGLSGLPQLSGLRMDSWRSPWSRQKGFVSRQGHSDASAEITEEDELPNTSHQLKRPRQTEKGAGGKPGGCVSV